MQYLHIFFSAPRPLNIFEGTEGNDLACALFTAANSVRNRLVPANRDLDRRVMIRESGHLGGIKAQRVKRLLTTDPGMGIVRHVDAGANEFAGQPGGFAFP